MENDKKSAIKEFIEYLEIFEKIRFRDGEKEYWLWREKELNQQYYNDGFDFYRKSKEES